MTNIEHNLESFEELSTGDQIQFTDGQYILS
jgi:hypothetical protein